MLIKRPMYNQQLQCVAYEILSHGQQMQHNEVIHPLFELINNSDTQLPLFIPYALKTLIEEADTPIENPIILRLQAEDIDSLYSTEEIQDSLFSIALVINNPAQLSWLNFADYIGITEELMNDADVTKVVKFSKANNRKIIAYDLDKPLSFDQCKTMTMDYYCGDFLFRPTEDEQIEIAASKLNLLQLIQILQKEDCDIDDISNIIETDPLLSYQLLKIANSAAFAGYQPIDTIAQAISRLGMNHLKNWILILSLKNVSDKPVEILQSGLVRAFMAEEIAKKRNNIVMQCAYTVGLLSIIDCLLNKNMATIMEHITLSDEIKTALISKSGPLGELLSLVVAYEEGNWDLVPQDECEALNLSKIYIDSLALVSKKTQALHS